MKSKRATPNPEPNLLSNDGGILASGISNYRAQATGEGFRSEEHMERRIPGGGDLGGRAKAATTCAHLKTGHYDKSQRD
jgi:hypothetical protein